MGILEQITKMKQQGIPDGEIINELSNQGISPREISDGLKQAQIKYAVSEDYGNMEPSIMRGDDVPVPDESQQQTYTPRAYEQPQYAPQQEEYAPQQPQEQYYAPSSGGYDQYSAGGIDTDTVMEISDQIFSDRIKKIQKQVDSLTEMSTLLGTKMENIAERFKRIESIIDKLQLAILEKVGSYGENLDSIKKEMSMMQDSFSKMISPARETRRTKEYSEETEEKEEPKRKVSKKK